MNNLLRCGRIIYAVGITALGILCFVAKDFIVGRPPKWAADIDVNPMLGYITGGIIIIAAIAILINKRPVLAALLIAVLIFLLSALRHFTHFMDDWANMYKTLALFGGTLIIAASFLTKAEHNNQRKIFILLGCICLAAFFIAAGYAHFKYADFVKALIPSFVPFHEFFTYFTAICMFAGAAGILIPQTRRLAALLSGIMILGWFLLLHIPRFLADTNNVSDRLGVFESFTFVGIFFVLSALDRGAKAA